MGDIFQIKYKIMQERMEKIKQKIEDCYNKKEYEAEDILKVLEVVSRKYEENFKRIINENNINKSLKYKQLEEIVFEELAKIEIRINRYIVKRQN